jgi:hypothetical protein
MLPLGDTRLDTLDLCTNSILQGAPVARDRVLDRRDALLHFIDSRGSVGARFVAPLSGLGIRLLGNCREGILDLLAWDDKSASCSDNSLATSLLFW